MSSPFVILSLAAAHGHLERHACGKQEIEKYIIDKTQDISFDYGLRPSIPAFVKLWRAGRMTRENGFDFVPPRFAPRHWVQDDKTASFNVMLPANPFVREQRGQLMAGT